MKALGSISTPAVSDYIPVSLLKHGQPAFRGYLKRRDAKLPPVETWPNKLAVRFNYAPHKFAHVNHKAG